MKKHNAQRILIYRLGSLGDTVVALPSFHLIANVYPNATRYVLTNTIATSKASHTGSVLGDSGFVQGYISYPAGLRNLWQLFQLRKEIRKFNPDILVYLQAARGRMKAYRDALFFRLCGIKKLVGIPYTEALQNNTWNAKEQCYEFEASRLARCISSLGSVELSHRKSWALNLTETEKKSAAEVLSSIGNESPIIACSVGAKVEVKDWGATNWSRLMERLSGIYKSYTLVFVGAEVEHTPCEQVGRSWKGKTLNLCGLLSPRESAAVLEKAKLFIGHDSGPMHLAAAMGTPCVAIFSARNKPKMWFPYGNNHRVIYHQTDCYGCSLDVCKVEAKKCIKSISVEEVEAAILQSLPIDRLQVIV